MHARIAYAVFVVAWLVSHREARAVGSAGVNMAAYTRVLAGSQCEDAGVRDGVQIVRNA